MLLAVSVDDALGVWVIVGVQLAVTALDVDCVDVGVGATDGAPVCVGELVLLPTCVMVGEPDLVTDVDGDTACVRVAVTVPVGVELAVRVAEGDTGCVCEAVAVAEGVAAELLVDDSLEDTDGVAVGLADEEGLADNDGVTAELEVAD